jgi:hypothetical protein
VCVCVPQSNVFVVTFFFLLVLNFSPLPNQTPPFNSTTKP